MIVGFLSSDRMGWMGMIGTRKGKGRKTDPDDERSPEETERIREATLKRILGTPPKSHKEMIADRRQGEPKRRKRPDER